MYTYMCMHMYACMRMRMRMCARARRMRCVDSAQVWLDGACVCTCAVHVQYMCMCMCMRMAMCMCAQVRLDGPNRLVELSWRNAVGIRRGVTKPLSVYTAAAVIGLNAAAVSALLAFTGDLDRRGGGGGGTRGDEAVLELVVSARRSYMIQCATQLERDVLVSTIRAFVREWPPVGSPPLPMLVDGIIVEVGFSGSSLSTGGGSGGVGAGCGGEVACVSPDGGVSASPDDLRRPLSSAAMLGDRLIVTPSKLIHGEGVEYTWFRIARTGGRALIPYARGPEYAPTADDFGCGAHPHPARARPYPCLIGPQAAHRARTLVPHPCTTPLCHACARSFVPLGAHMPLSASCASAGLIVVAMPSARRKLHAAQVPHAGRARSSTVDGRHAAAGLGHRGGGGGALGDSDDDGFSSEGESTYGGDDAPSDVIYGRPSHLRLPDEVRLPEAVETRLHRICVRGVGEFSVTLLPPLATEQPSGHPSQHPFPSLPPVSAATTPTRGSAAAPPSSTELTLVLGRSSFALQPRGVGWLSRRQQWPYTDEVGASLEHWASPILHLSLPARAGGGEVLRLAASGGTVGASCHARDTIALALRYFVAEHCRVAAGT